MRQGTKKTAVIPDCGKTGRSLLWSRPMAGHRHGGAPM